MSVLSSFVGDPVAILDRFSDPVIVLDEHQVIVGANPAAANLIGLPSSRDLIGRSTNELVHEPDRVDATERLLALLEDRQPHPVSLRLVRTDGSLVWVEVTGSVTDTDAGLRFLLGFRNIDWRQDADLDAAHVIRRSHLLVDTAIELQSTDPGQMAEVLNDTMSRIGSALGAVVVAAHEVEPDGASLVLRARWASTASSEASRAIAASTIPLEKIPNWVNALNSLGAPIELRNERLALQTELGRVEPALQEGLSIPLQPGERLLGALTVGWEPGTRLSSDERDFLQQAAAIVGAAFQRVRVQQALIESEALFRDLFESSSAVMYLVEPDTLRLVDVNEAAARFYGYRRDEMVGMDLHRLTVHSRDEQDALVHSVGDEGTTVIDTRQRLADGSLRTVEVHATKIRLGPRTLDLAIVQDVTEQRRAVEALEKLASTDDLTGVYNRRRFLQLLEEEIHRCERYGRDLSLLMLDLDHFKGVNDSFGHLAGDAVLVAFAVECTALLRSSDRLARVGGEEFAVLLPETGRDDAALLAERIRRATEQSSVDHPTGPIAVTVSIGVVQWERGWSVDDLYAKADRLLYRAKQEGRNRLGV